MKINLSTAAALLCAGSVKAFSPLPSARARTSTELNLFGSGDKSGAAKGPNMMDQLAMFKKAQEVAQKKQELDKELQQMEFKGTAADGKIAATFKYMPVKNPMDPNPDYEMASIDFDDDYFESASPEDISVGVVEAFRAGVAKTNEAVMEKYASLTSDLGEVLGGAAPKSG